MNLALVPFIMKHHKMSAAVTRISVLADLILSIRTLGFSDAFFN
jgi:hypothetical protein